MDRISNPYAPGAGAPPPALEGRDEICENVRIAIQRLRMGRPSKSVLLVGLRGVGKTVLLEQLRNDADDFGVQTVWLEAPEDRSLPGLLAPKLRSALLRLSRIESAKELANRALSGLAGFVGALKLRYADIEVSLDYEAEPGLADNGDLELDLTDLLEVIGRAAQGANSAFVIFVDELQYVEEDQLAALITALHRTVQRKLPVMLVGAGLPQLRGRTGKAKSYAERLFEFPDVGPLDDEAARAALEKPAQQEGVKFKGAALKSIVKQTQGYPYFLQEWGKHAWEEAEKSPITKLDTQRASENAIEALDTSFFRVRFDRLTPLEKRYLRSMAELGPGPHRSGEIAKLLGRKVESLAPTRNQLISKGMIWSPSHGDTAFTVPLFDEFMHRIMPDDAWKNA